ncbi:rhodanese-like domain-containing protein [Spiroplasma endosymbiont of Poecilobothrus nobilitatus]|uniref:rhodanese-like domain-containing protein n=1 Tax=Spiroplasma endosymbiont of Poecilobothrus nobilitatus TaxID=1209220 RepID=UPI00313E30EF
MNQKAVYIDNEIFEAQKERALLLDDRTEIEFKALRQIPNSINVYIFDLFQDTSRYLSDKNQLIITLCNGGNRSS